MLRPLARLTSMCLTALALSACYVFGFGVARAVPVGPGGPPNAQPTPAIPQIHLEYGGQSFAGVQSSYGWHTANSVTSGSSWGGQWPPSFPSTLVAPIEQNIAVVVNFSPPAALWVAELDNRGVPTTSTALTPTGSSAAYTLTNRGQYTLMVTAQWSYQDFVTYYFALDVEP